MMPQPSKSYFYTLREWYDSGDGDFKIVPPRGQIAFLSTYQGLSTEHGEPMPHSAGPPAAQNGLKKLITTHFKFYDTTAGIELGY